MSNTTGLTEFRYGHWTLFDAIDALKAYDHGALDSGVKDEGLKSAVRNHLRSLSPADRRRACAAVARKYLSDEAIQQGYGLEDVKALIEWLEETHVD